MSHPAPFSNNAAPLHLSPVMPPTCGATSRSSPVVPPRTTRARSRHAAALATTCTRSRTTRARSRNRRRSATSTAPAPTPALATYDTG